MKRPRDSQRQKVYDAEQTAYNDTRGELDARYDVGGLDGAQTLINRVFSSGFLRDLYVVPFNEAPLAVRGHGKRERGCYRASKNEIHLPEWTQQNWYVLHECAHALTRHYGGAAHDWRFAKCYLDLVRVYMSRAYADRLERAFKLHRVRYKPPRTQTISDAERRRRSEHARSLHA